MSNGCIPCYIAASSFLLPLRCEDCVRINDRWVHLRICQTCGKMLCCDSSKNQHARRHYEEIGHSVISSAELGEQWLWCFADEHVKSY